MKKLALALVCFASVAFFASCTKPVDNPEPSIQIYTEEGYVQNGDIVDLEDDAVDVYFGFVVASNTETNKKLTSLAVTVDDAEWETVEFDGETSYTYKDVIAYTFTRDEIVGASSIKAVVTDEAGKTNTATIEIQFNQPDVPILSMPIEWKREGSNVVEADDEEMKFFGLQWTGSYKEVFATIQTLNDDVIMYVCNGDDFDGIETMSDKNAYFTNLAEMGAETTTKYRNITTNNSDDYNDMLAIINGESKHLIRISHARLNLLPIALDNMSALTSPSLVP
jgi:hypothetical protein